jgi:hypothetical protein
MLDRSSQWRTSSYSGNASGNCVEVAAGSRTVHVRDTKDREGGVQRFGAAAWSAFLAALR